MAKKLVIVESPAKARTINKYLGREFTVMASVGHIKDLPEKELGVDIENDFRPTYVIIPDEVKKNNQKILAELKRAAREAEAIYLAADPDREGEAICQHLKEELVGPREEKPVYRVLFHEITPHAVREAFQHPGTIDRHKVEAQQARRILDRLVGYLVSPLLWKKVRRGLSAGRVQSVALRLIVEREREIERFVPTEYWTLGARLSAAEPPPFVARLVRIGEQTLKTSEFEQGVRPTERHIRTEEEAQELVRQLSESEFVVASVERKEKKRHPVPPFTTSKLQQEAARRLRFSVKKTMSLAQKLYEGVDLGPEGSVGLITYMRTDSTRVSETALAEVRRFIAERYGEELLPEEPHIYRTKKDAQDAHEAIRPTSVFRTPEQVAPYLSRDELALYKLIWQRFVASQMKPALFDQTVLEIRAGTFTFRATGSVLRFSGFLTVYEEAKEEKENEEEEEATAVLPKVEVGEKLTLLELLPEQHFTQPPPRYTEASLVKALEENGIGRPSTYAQILSIIQDRAYVQKVNGRFKPTALGRLVCDLLVEHFTDIFDVEYTAEMEAELDKVEEGRVSWVKVLRDFYKKFAADLARAEREMEDVRKGVETDEQCPACGTSMVKKIGRYGPFLACPSCGTTQKLSSPEEEGGGFEEITCEKCGRKMVLRQSRFGPFLACTGYPECTNTRRIQRDGQLAAPDRTLDEPCPECGAPLVARQGPYGEYIACSRRPACPYVKLETLGIPCPRPDCQGELVVRRSRRGRIFYGCSAYPQCSFTVWDRPVNRACPQCGASFLLEKVTRRKERIQYCHRSECSYREAVVEEETVPSTLVRS
ncbi:MAG: type I DNA topoisomerase [Blastocatellia bacterium]|nr:type I DNA topoisomerase [Blastocatellia bacterium]MCX7752987.1 type I DNA topoisomerase [Blastocatellia bacterium]MDW8168510.1 type I DNA topoisomerase [Acidobacteriota bacterium]